jgi:hypothetical protein|tara:strand:+ start:267 stop:461 length:195 start_codon:yes stop_codon:yes gene_type:complete
VLVIQAVHEDRVYDKNQHEGDDRTLLGDPKTEWSASYGWHIGVEPIAKKNATATADDEPNSEEG